jgi:hypothetical protein
MNEAYLKKKQKNKKKKKSKCMRKTNEPHVVDGWCKREFQGLYSERSACFRPGGAKGEVYLDFIFVFLEFLENVANSHDNTGYRRSAEHPHDGNLSSRLNRRFGD